MQHAISVVDLAVPYVRKAGFYLHGSTQLGLDQGPCGVRELTRQDALAIDDFESK